MRNKFSFFIGFIAIVLTTFFIASPVFAQVADGTYDISYEMKEANSENTSIADGYFSKPAKLTVENGVQHIQLTVTSSNYIKALSAPSGPVTILNEDEANQTRTVKFRVDGDLSNPVNMEMKVVVPDLYDTTHTARAVFNVSDLPEAEAQATDTDNNSEDTGAVATDDSSTTAGSSDTSEVVENPKTGENASLMLYALLMLGAAAGLVIIWKLRPVRN